MPDVTTSRQPGRDVAGRGGHRSRVQWLLAGVALLFFVAEVTVTDVTRPPAFDEAIYLSEVQRGAEGISFAAHRARGITWLIQPVAGLGAPITAVRLWLALLSAVGLFLAFRPWIASVGHNACLAAALTGTCWGTLFYATDIAPNVLAAFAAAAAVGYAFRPATTPMNRDLVGVAVSMAVLAVVRPSETVWVGLFLALALPLRGRRGMALLVSAGAGTALGWVPWIVEAYLRWYGPLERLRRVRGATLDVDFGRRIFDYLALADGPTSVQGSVQPMSAAAAVGAVVVLALIMYGTVRRDPGSSAMAVRAAAAAGLFLLVPYVLLTDSVYVRFLLPAWALAAIPLAEGIRGLVRKGTLTAVVAAALVLAWGVGQYTTARHISGSFAVTTRQAEALANAVEPLVDRPCFLIAEGGYPQVGYGAGCLSDWYRPEEEEPFRTDPANRAEGGRNVYVLGRTSHPAIEDWPNEPVPDHPDWRLYTMPDSTG